MKYWFVGLLVSVSTNILAEDVVVYRWVDENNVVHFSQNQPASGNYTEMLMANTGQSKQAANKVPEKMATEKLAKTEVAAKISVDNESICKESQENLKTLKAFERVRIVDENGETQILTKEEREEQITINNNQIDMYCK